MVQMFLPVPKIEWTMTALHHVYSFYICFCSLT